MKLWNGKYLVLRRDGTVPAWNWFVLGARDPYASHALLAYAHAVADHAKELEAKKDPVLRAQVQDLKEYAQSVLDLAADFEIYRAKEGDGDPTGAPWRTEAPDVMRALNGSNSVIVAFAEQDNSKTKPPKG